MVEIGLLYMEKPLVRLGFYRRNELLDDTTSKRIFIALYGLFREIFDDTLQELDFDDYRVLFYVFPIKGAPAKDTNKIDDERILVYCVLDLEGRKSNNVFRDTMKLKMVKLSELFRKRYSQDEFMVLVKTHNFKPFMSDLMAVFKDLTIPSTDRFGTIFGNPPYHEGNGKGSE
ncbi:hypothetical protein GF325_14065 [Candidatus Bathyarchaeota archaeon]|nr:hypothetical protein [Candidatus Bathyarchaeota archaeon]